MTVEEKAKAYDEALERAKAYHRNELAGSRKEMTEYIFPELRESEDEIVRKGIIDGMKCLQERGRILFYGMPIKDVIVWLEKQKEQKPAEQDSEEVFDKIDSSFRKGREVGFKEGVESVKPAEWSEEDERMLERTIHIIVEYSDIDEKESEIVQNWLKSLRPQPQGIYKLIVHNIYEMLKDKDFFDITPSHRVSLLNDIRVRCKNASEQAEILDVPSWKPSEEQMEAFRSVLEYEAERVGSSKYLEKANSLYEQLKKL